MASLFSLLASLHLLASTISISEAREFLVGGSTNGWKIPSSPSDSLNKWAESTRFQVGDSLVWNYDAKKDSVLQVTRRDYKSCNTSSPSSEHADGHTVVRLHHPGPYYFVGGGKGACEKGEKLVVVVMAPRTYAGIAPAPSPMVFDGPAAAPTSGGPSTKAVGCGSLGALLVLMGVLGVVLF